MKVRQVKKLFMKKIKFINVFVFALLVVIAYSFTTKNSFKQQSTKDKIIGSWVSDSDPANIWVFSSDNKCKRFHNGSLLNTSDFSISNYSCSNEIDAEYEYLKLKINADKEYCYAINGITQDGEDVYLSLEYDGNPRPMLFKKQ